MSIFQMNDLMNMLKEKRQHEMGLQNQAAANARAQQVSPMYNAVDRVGGMMMSSSPASAGESVAFNERARDRKDSNFSNLKKLLDAIKGDVPSGGGTPGSNGPIFPPKQPSSMMPGRKVEDSYDEWTGGNW